MKRYLLASLLFTLTFLSQSVFAQSGDDLLNLCHGKLGDSRFLKSWPVQLPEQGRGEPIPQQSFKMPLNSGTTYKIYGCNAEELPGKVIISVRDQNDRLILTTYLIDQKKHIPQLNFQVNSSGIYSFSFYFEDGKQGRAVGVVSSVN